MKKRHWFKQGLVDLDRLLAPTKDKQLKREFQQQKFSTLPSPALWEEMLAIEYPAWEKMCKALAVFWGAIPPSRGPFFVPAHQLMGAKQTLSKMLAVLQEEIMFDESTCPLVTQLRENAKKLSEKRGHEGILLPHEFVGTDEEFLYGFLRYTPFYKMFTHGVSFAFPMEARRVHTTFTASSQSGKTYLMKTQVLTDATREHPYACIVIDPKDDVWAPERGKGALWEHLARDTRLTNKVLITPDDVPGINLFDVRGENFNQLYESYEYFFSAILGSDMTPPMQTMLRHVIALCLKIPNATLDTMQGILTDFRPFKQFVTGLSDVDRQYFETEFGEKGKGTAGLTRDAVRHRINGMRAGAMGTMFRAQRNMVKLREWIDQRKTIIIHASPNKLGKDYRAFGRYFIAEAIRAARSRHTTHQVFLFVDEASNFFDQKTELIMEYMATSNFAGIFAFQQWSQAQRAGVDSAMGNARIQIFGGYHDEDLSTFRAKLYPDRRGRLDTMPPGNFYARIAGKPAFTFQVPKLENAFMSEEDYRAFRDRNRELLISPPPIETRELTVVKDESDDVDVD